MLRKYTEDIIITILKYFHVHSKVRTGYVRLTMMEITVFFEGYNLGLNAV
jgi:hypothetical protein